MIISDIEGADAHGGRKYGEPDRIQEGHADAGDVVRSFIAAPLYELSEDGPLTRIGYATGSVAAS